MIVLSEWLKNIARAGTTMPIINKSTLVICVSQSGETIDTLEALKYAQQGKKEALEKYCFEQIAKEHNKFISEVVEYFNSLRAKS